MINLILADHEKIFRIGMAAALSSEDDIHIVGQPHTSGQLLDGLEKVRPHVLVLSSAFLGCLDTIKQSCKYHQTAMLFLQDHDDGPTPSADFDGVLGRSADEKTAVRCVRHLARGGRVIRRTPLASRCESADEIGKRVRDRLTKWELGVVSYVVGGYKNREIARRLGTTEQSIKNSLRAVFDKTGVYGRLELALFVLHHGALNAASSKTFRSPHLASMTDLQRRWDGNGSFAIH
jgi:DNA-binding NarL/FixJ family response regulator